MQLKNASTLADLSKMFNLVLKGWYNYYGRFYPSAMSMIWRNLNWYLVQWVRRKYKRFAGHKKRARQYRNGIAHANAEIFQHWKLGYFPDVRVVGAV